MECKGWSCSSYYSHASEGFISHCRGSNSSYKPNSHSSFTDSHGNEYNFVCFRLQSSNQLVNFYFAGQKIVNSVHVSSDRFPLTCDNGWCISGEWFSTSKVQGKIRNPNNVYTDYTAQWIGS